MTKESLYKKDILECEKEAKQILHKKYRTEEVVMLTLKLWRDSKEGRN